MAHQLRRRSKVTNKPLCAQHGKAVHIGAHASLKSPKTDPIVKFTYGDRGPSLQRKDLYPT